MPSILKKSRLQENAEQNWFRGRSPAVLMSASTVIVAINARLLRLTK